MILHALDRQAHRYSHLLVDRNGNSKRSDFPLSSSERSWVSNILFPMRHNCLPVKNFQHIILTIIIQDCFTPNASTSLLGKHCQLANFWCDYSFCESVLTLCKTNTEIRGIKCIQKAWISLASMAYIWLIVGSEIGPSKNISYIIFLLLIVRKYALTEKHWSCFCFSQNWFKYSKQRIWQLIFKIVLCVNWNVVFQDIYGVLQWQNEKKHLTCKKKRQVKFVRIQVLWKCIQFTSAFS